MDEPADRSKIEALVEQLLTGQLKTPQFIAALMTSRRAEVDYTTLDLDRRRRCGFPEVVYGEGKTAEILLAVCQAIVEAGLPLLATRVAPEKAERLLQALPTGQYNTLARTFRLEAEDAIDLPGVSQRDEQGVARVAVVSAGTSDAPVSEEACETLLWMGVETVKIHDVGVAGPHRLPAHLDTLRSVDAVVVVAGMEGALPSVVGGYVNCPVVGVPTSVGYGASFGGVSALLGMLNSCASNVTVVNIDAGFKGGYIAGLIALNRHTPRDD